MQDIYPSRLAGEPELLPRQDPVAYGNWQADAPLSKEQVEHFDRHGSLVLEDIFDECELDLLQDVRR